MKYGSLFYKHANSFYIPEIEVKDLNIEQSRF